MTTLTKKMAEDLSKYLDDVGIKVKYLHSDIDTLERMEIIRESKVKLETQRYKGLGEMNADQLWETTMNPETRSLDRVNIYDVALAEKRVSVLMGEKVEPRKEWIEENVVFSLEDNYQV